MSEYQNEQNIALLFDAIHKMQAQIGELQLQVQKLETGRRDDEVCKHHVRDVHGAKATCRACGLVEDCAPRPQTLGSQIIGPGADNYGRDPAAAFVDLGLSHPDGIANAEPCIFCGGHDYTGQGGPPGTLDRADCPLCAPKDAAKHLSGEVADLAIAILTRVRRMRDDVDALADASFAREGKTSHTISLESDAETIDGVVDVIEAIIKATT
jgi:hypothetical protein